MKKFNLIDFISKLGAAALSSGGEQKSDGIQKKPDGEGRQNDESLKGIAPIGGDFSSKNDSCISPKQSVVEMIRRHEALSKRIDKSLSSNAEE